MKPWWNSNLKKISLVNISRKSQKALDLKEFEDDVETLHYRIQSKKKLKCHWILLTTKWKRSWAFSALASFSPGHPSLSVRPRLLWLPRLSSLHLHDDQENDHPRRWLSQLKFKSNILFVTSSNISQKRYNS